MRNGLLVGILSAVCFVGNADQASLRAAVQERVSGAVNSLTLIFNEFKSLSNIQGENGASCNVNGASLTLSGQVSDATQVQCKYTISFTNGQVCNCKVGISEPGSSYFVWQSCDVDNCYRVVGNGGDNNPGAPVWPCQGQGQSDGGCWWAMTSTSVTLSPNAPAKRTGSKISVNWSPSPSSAMKLKVELTGSSSSSSSKDVEDSLSLSASVSYGPASISGSAAQNVKTNIQKQLSASNTESSEIDYPACPDGTYRWRQSYQVGQTNILTNIAICTEGNVKPKCPMSLCNMGADKNCQVCFS